MSGCRRVTVCGQARSFDIGHERKTDAHAVAAVVRAYLAGVALAYDREPAVLRLLVDRREELTPEQTDGQPATAATGRADPGEAKKHRGDSLGRLTPIGYEIIMVTSATKAA